MWWYACHPWQRRRFVKQGKTFFSVYCSEMHQQIFHKFTFKFHDHRNGIAVKNHWLVGNQKEVNSKKHGIAITILFEVPRKKTWKKKHTFPASKKKTPNPKIQVQLTGWLCSRWMLVKSYRAQKLQNTILKEIPRSLFDFKATSNRAQLIFPDWFFKDTGLLKKTDQFSIMSYLLEKSTRWVRVRYRVLPRSPTGPVFSR